MPLHPARISEPDARRPVSSTDLPEGVIHNAAPTLVLRKRTAETEDSRDPLGKRTRLDISVPSLRRQVSSSLQDVPSSPSVEPGDSGWGNIPGGSRSVVDGTTDSGSMTEAYTQAEHELARRRADVSKFRHQRLESTISEASEGLKAKHYEWMKAPIIVLIRPLLDYVTAHEDRFDSQVHGIDTRMRIMGDNIQGLRLDVTALGERVTRLEDRVTGLGSEVTQLGSEVTQLGLRVNELSSEVKNHRIESTDRFKQVDEKLDSILSMMKANLDRST